MDSREIELIKRAQQGSVDAFDALVRLHDRQILQMICSIVGNQHDAYDVYQDTFIRAFAKISSFRFESELSTWLGRIAINLSINWRKKQRRRTWFSLDARKERGEPAPSEALFLQEAGIESSMLDKELQREVKKGLNTLPEQQRVVFVLKHYHGYKIREIADMIDIAEGTVKNHLFRATQKLQKVLKVYYRIDK